MRGSDEKTIRIARRLRANQTDAETVLWNRIRNRQIDGHKFARQVPIGRYICDFVCREKRVVIEVDGGQHNDSAEDVVRDRYPIAEGYRVLDFGTTMCSAIWKVCWLQSRPNSADRAPHPPSPRKKGGERGRESCAGMTNATA
jgi:very-short-patch-repair endonuclease